LPTPRKRFNPGFSFIGQKGPFMDGH